MGLKIIIGQCQRLCRVRFRFSEVLNYVNLGCSLLMKKDRIKCIDKEGNYVKKQIFCDVNISLLGCELDYIYERERERVRERERCIGGVARARHKEGIFVISPRIVMCII